MALSLARGGLGLVSLMLVLGMAPAAEPRVPAGGAPPAGSGAQDIRGFVRVIDGDTIEAYIKGQRVGIGLIGIAAPMGNTACGRQAAAHLRTLVRGGLRLEEDPAVTFDARGRRMYRAQARDGRSIAEAQIRAGVARVSADGAQPEQLAAAEAQARAGRAGCVWRGRAAADAAGEGFASFDLGLPAEAGPGLPPGPLAVAAAPAATSLPSGFAQDVLASGLTDPTAFAILPDGRTLIAEKKGIVRVLKNGGLLATPLVDLQGRVNDYWDRGLLSIAADKDFATNGHLYLLYAYENDAAQYSGPKTGRLTRVTASGDTAPLSSELVLLGTSVGSSCNNFPAGADCIPSDSPSHSTGNVKVAPDGNLFVTLGDGAKFNLVDDDALRAQNLDSLGGKVLRVSPSGAGLPSNPFPALPTGANQAKVWARGVRNAFRFDLRPSSGLPYIGDVGWSSWEEVNVVPGGANLGWPCYEGAARQAGYEPKAVCQSLYAAGASAVRPPLHAYEHAGQGAAVTGGAFYTGTTYSSQYQGAFFFADYARGFIRYLRVDANDALVGSVADFAGGADGPVAMQMGPDESLYYLAIGTGELRRIRYGAPAEPGPPVSTGYLSDQAWASMSNGWGPVEKNRSNGEDGAGDGGTLTLNGTAYAKGLGAHAPSDVRYNLAGACSTFTAALGVDDEMENRGSVVFEVWADGARLWESGLMGNATPTRAVNLNLAGKRELALIVTDAGDGTTSDHADWADARVTCGANTAPTPTISSPAASLRFKVGDVISYAGSATDAEDGPVPASRLAWRVEIHHCPGTVCHEHLLTSGSGSGGTFTVPDHGDGMRLEIVLTATDSAGQSGSSSVTIQPLTVDLTLATTPSGLEVVFDGTSGTAPLTRTMVVGSSHTIQTPSPQGGYVFGSWSDGGAQQHNVTAGAANAAYTATFRPSEPTPPPAARVTTGYLSDQTWTSMTNGWGPVEKNRSNGENGPADGRTLKLARKTYSKGLGTHAASDVRYTLGGACSTFSADVGVDDEVGNRGSVIFQVWADGAKLWDSGLMRGSSATKKVNLSVAGKNELALIVTTGGDGTTSDHADWASAQVTCS